MMTHGAAIKEAILKDDTLMKSRHCWCVYFELIKFAHVGKKLQTQKGANKHGPSCSVPPFTRWTVTIVTRVLWPAPVSPLLRNYICLFSELCCQLPSNKVGVPQFRALQSGKLLWHIIIITSTYSYSRHTQIWRVTRSMFIRQWSAADNQPSVMPANALMHDDDGMGPTFDPFNFSHERREITPAFWWQINMNMMIIWALDTAIPLSMIEFLLAQQ